jgi:3-hydroxyisobutyrate dehydrogenase-like beta-hydroxyacid dehydrogenase
MHVAILGIGEVGSTLARDLLAANVRVSGWDPNPRHLPDGLKFAASNPDATIDADVILSSNLASVAVDVAAEVLPHLQAGQVYADMNTASPMIKREIDGLFQDSAAIFTDVAIMAPIAPKGIRTPMLACGDGAAQFADMLSPVGMPVTVLDEPTGQAATQKLVRSIFYKGLAAVVMETLEAAEKLELTSYAREQMLTLLKDEPMIDRMVSGSKTHARRRIHEMDAVIELLQEVGVPAHTSAAARQRLIALLAMESVE